MDSRYILKGHKPILCNDLIKWAKWVARASRHVAKTQVSEDIKVSTVFLGLDHNFGEGDPILFETVVFGGKLDQEMQRYSTWQEAEKGHREWVKKAKKAK